MHVKNNYRLILLFAREGITKYSILEYCLVVILIQSVLMIVGCEKKHSTNPETTESWTKVAAFGDEPIWGLHVNQDSTEMHVISTNFYGYHHLGQQSDEFTTTVLNNPIEYKDNGFCEELPYIDDEYCFYCSDSGTIMHIFGIAGGVWKEKGTLNVHSFMPDSTDRSEYFGRSYWYNKSNHIINAGEGDYYITTQMMMPYVRGSIKFAGAHFQRNLVHMDINSTVSYDNIYQTDLQTMTVTEPLLYSSHWLYNRFIQFQDVVNESMMIYMKDSPTPLSGSCRYPIIDVFAIDDILVGIACGVVMRSSDQGLNWEEWLCINAIWSHVLIGGKHILFYYNNIAQWDVEGDPTSSIMLESNPLLDLRISYIAQFGDYVYAATDQGLYKRPLSTFFTPRDSTTNRSETTLQIWR